MKNLKKMSDTELKEIIGGKYYGNGVSCNKKGCTVNWGAAASCSVSRLANWGHGNC